MEMQLPCLPFFRGRRKEKTKESSPLNDTSAHFLSTVKIQCHVQSLFINRSFEEKSERVEWLENQGEWRKNEDEKLKIILAPSDER